MNEAVELDNQCIENNKPAINKLKLLSHMKSTLSKVDIRPVFLEMSGLVTLQEWLKKASDNSYPCINQMDCILDILNNLPIEANFLNNCNIAKIIMDIFKHYTGSSTIKNKAKDLFEKWARLIWDINTNYSVMDYDNSACARIFGNKKRQRTDSESKKFEDEEILQNARKKNSTYIPRKDCFDFVVYPFNSVTTQQNNTLSTYEMKKSILKKSNRNSSNSKR